MNIFVTQGIYWSDQIQTSWNDKIYTTDIEYFFFNLKKVLFKESYLGEWMNKDKYI